MSVFNTIPLLSGASIGIVGGTAAWNGTNAGNANETAIYNQATTATDYQAVSIVFSALNNNATAACGTAIMARVNANGSGVAAFFSNGSLFLGTMAVGASFSTLTTVGHTPVVGDTYTLVAGTAAGLYNFQVLHNGTSLLTATDAAHTSQIGPGFRGAGFYMQSPVSTTVPASISSFSFTDNTAVYPVGSVLRVNRTNTATVNGTAGTNLLPGSFFDTVQLNTADFTYSSSTNTVTILNPGTYRVKIALYIGAFASSIGNSYLAPVLYHNGTVDQQGLQTPTTTAAAGHNFCDSFDTFCAAGDTLQPGYNLFATANGLLTGEATGTFCYMTVALANCGTLS